MVTVTKDNFIEASEDLLKNLGSATFVAIDEEMSGISMPSTGRMRKGATCPEIYERLKAVPETYCIIQIGVCLFHKNPKFGDADATGDEAEYLARPYNFFLFPQAVGRSRSKAPPAERNIVLNPSSMEFLNKHGMDFNAWTKMGVGYVTLDEAQGLAEQFATSAQKSLDRQEESISLEGLAASNAAALDIPVPPSVTRAINGSGGGEASAATATAAGAGAQGSQPGQNNASQLAAIPTWIANAQARAQVQPQENPQPQQQPQPQPQPQPQMQFLRSSDVEYVSQTMAHLREWLDNSSRVIPPTPDGGTAASHSQLMLPSCNAALRRALYEAISESYPSLVLELGKDAMRRDCIVVLRLTTQERKERLIKKQREAVTAFKHQLGFTRVFKALTQACAGTFDPDVDCDGNVNFMIPNLAANAEQSPANVATPTEATSNQKIPLIVHNGFMDLMFMMTHFVSPSLPQNWADAKAMLHRQFPVIFDTKCMAEEYLDESVLEGRTLAQSGWYTSLDGLYQTFTTIGAVITTTRSDGRPTFPVRQLNLSFASAPTHVTGNAASATAVTSDSHTAAADSVDTTRANGTAASTQVHEAGYDAYMTGAVYYFLARYILKAYQQRNDLNGALSECTKGSLYASFFHSLDDYITGKNKLYCWGTIYIMNLDVEPDRGEDLLQRGLHPSFIYRVSGFRRPLKNRDIHGAITNLYGMISEPSWRSQYSIMWIDDNTFYLLVRPMRRHFLWIPSNTRPEKKVDRATGSDADTSTPLGQYRRVASVIYNCLVDRFGEEHVQTLQEYNDGAKEAASLASPSLLSRITPSRNGKRKRRDSKNDEQSDSNVNSPGIISTCLDFTAGLLGKKQKT